MQPPLSEAKSPPDRQHSGDGDASTHDTLHPSLLSPSVLPGTMNVFYALWMPCERVWQGSGPHASYDSVHYPSPTAIKR